VAAFTAIRINPARGPFRRARQRDAEFEDELCSARKDHFYIGPIGRGEAGEDGTHFHQLLEDRHPWRSTNVARIARSPMHSVVVECTRMGGGFWRKGNAGRHC